MMSVSCCLSCNPPNISQMGPKKYLGEWFQYIRNNRANVKNDSRREKKSGT